MGELIDVYDANLTLLGQRERVVAHEQGDWHVTFHLWILIEVEGKFCVVYQLRSPTKASFPDVLDVSAAGHLGAGERPIEGLREVEEELGLKLTEDEVTSLGYRVEVADESNGQKNREYQAVFMARADIALERFEPDTREVYGLVAVPIGSGLDLHCDRVPSIEVHARTYSEEDRIWVGGRRTIGRTDFLPRIQNYYLTVHVMAERYLAKKAVSIS